MKKHTKLLYKIIANLVVIFLLLYGLQYVVDNGLRKSRLNYYAVWNDIYSSKANADVLIVGGSRSWMHVSTNILDSVLHINSYNIGIDGWYIPMQFARVKIYMNHNPKPKYILQSVDLTLFYDRKDLFVSEQFLPYLDDTILQNITGRYIGKFTTPEYLIPAFKYNNHFDLVKEGIRCYFNMKKRGGNLLYKGYGGVDMQWNDVFDQLKEHNPNGVHRIINPYVLDRFDAYIKYCKANGIQMIFAFHPLLKEEYLMEVNKQETLDLIHKYCKEYDIPFLDYSNDSMCYNQKYYIDYQHLNKAGSEIFSRKLANDLKAVIH